MSMTMNGAVLPMLAFYIVAAEEQGVAPAQLTGTIQNDILKEYMVRNTYIYPPAQSMRIVADIFAYTAAEMPKFNSISISGYHIQEAGATADIELAYTLANGLQYLRAGLAAGLDIDAFAPRLSFFWGIGMNYFMEIAKDAGGASALGEAGQAIQAAESQIHGACGRIARHRAGACRRKTPSTMSSAPAWKRWRRFWAARNRCIPTRWTKRSPCPPTFSARIARNTQLFLQHETGITDVVDPWGGAYLVERLTHDLARRAWAHIQEIEDAGRHDQSAGDRPAQDAH